jgi:hypothetical protein
MWLEIGVGCGGGERRFLGAADLPLVEAQLGLADCMLCPVPELKAATEGSFVSISSDSATNHVCAWLQSKHLQPLQLSVSCNGDPD